MAVCAGPVVIMAGSSVVLSALVDLFGASFFVHQAFIINGLKNESTAQPEPLQC